MTYEPEKSADDFYKGYDVNVGVGTALVLLLFFFVVTAKSLGRCAIRRWRFLQYKNKKSKQPRTETKRGAA